MRGVVAIRFFALVVAALVISLPLSSAVSYSLTYDDNGNLVSGDGFYREYDSFNQLSLIRNGSNSSAPVIYSFVYHPTEERVLVKYEYNSSGAVIETTRYVSKTFVQVENSSGIYNTTYVRDNGVQVAQITSTGEIEYVHPDHEGSTAVTTDENGSVIERNLYEPYGKAISGGETTRYDYEGKETDHNLNDIDFDARRYNPEWGIFTQPDSILPDVYDPQQLNRYAFERNNPYKYVDATGHYIETAVDVAFITVSLYDVKNDPGNVLNWVALAGDVVSVLIPLFAGGGTLLKVALKADEAADATKTIAKNGNKIENVKAGDLPKEARDISQKIERGETNFKYDKDGSTFRNKEGNLPEGEYKEYTVDTPGASDRGEQRIVSDTQGNQYYSNDHYKTFKKIEKNKDKADVDE